MKRATEFTVFGALAVGLHVVLMAEWPQSGAEAGGVGGEALVSIIGSTPQIETMVATWERPPQIQQRVDLKQPEIQAIKPLLPMASVRLDAAPNTELKMAAIEAPEPPDLPKPDMETPPPPRAPNSEPEPEDDPDVAQLPKTKPKTRPKPQVRNPKPKAKASDANRKASLGAARQKAAGSGGTAQAGNSGTASAKTLSPGKEASLVAVWGSRIRAQVERRKRMPPGTKAKGTVTLKISVSRDGRLRGVSIRGSSGDAKLDAAAVAAVKTAGRFPRAPKELTKDVFSFSLPIKFSR